MPTLVVYPDARPLTVTPTGAEIGSADLAKASFHIKADWGSPVTLPAWSVIAADGTTEPARAFIEEQLALLLYDLGNSSLDAWFGARNAIRNSAIAAREPKQDSLLNLARGRAVICVASGPTARDHMAEIVEAQARGAIIVCADTIYQPLAAAGVRPHIVCCIERIPCFSDIVVPSVCPSTILVAPPIIDATTHAGWDGRRVWYWQATPGLYGWLGPQVPNSFSGRSAGTLAAVVAILLGGSSLYFVGHDLCHVGDQSHAPGVHQLGPQGQKKLEDEATPGSMFAVEPITCRDGVGRRSNKFWRMCRDDIAAALTDYGGKAYAVDRRGACIAGAETVDAINVGPGIPFPAIDAKALPITPSIDRSNSAEAITKDHAAFRRIIDTVPRRAPPGSQHLARLQLREWADHDMVGLYSYVFSTIYHGASLRMHLRYDERWHDLAAGILRRAIPAQFTIMERDLC